MPQLNRRGSGADNSDSTSANHCYENPRRSSDSVASLSSDRHTTVMGVFRETSVAVSACLCMLMTGCWLAWPSPALKKLLHGNARISINEYQASWAVSIMDIGNMISPLPAAYLVDRLGRKSIMLFTGPLFLSCSLLTFPASSVNYLYLARFLAGVGKGIAFTVCPMYLGEIASVNIRGALSTISIGFLWGGSILMFCIGPLVTYDTLNIITGVIPLIFLITFIWMPESPYSLLMRNNYSEAKNSLEWLRHGNVDTGKELVAMRDYVEEEMKTKGTYMDLISVPSNRKATSVVMVSSAFQRLCGISCALAYSSTTLPLSSGLPFLGQNEIIMVFGLLLTAANFIATPLVDSLGRKPLLMVSSIGCSISMAAAGFYYLLVPALDRMGWVPYSSLLLFGMFQAIGLGVIPSTLLAELFPSNVKSKAAAVSSIVFAVASFLINKMYMPVKQNYGVHLMFFFFSLNSLMAFFFTIFVVFETKGKTFQEIQNKLKGR